MTSVSWEFHLQLQSVCIACLLTTRLRHHFTLAHKYIHLNSSASVVLFKHLIVDEQFLLVFHPKMFSCTQNLILIMHLFPRCVNLHCSVLMLGLFLYSCWRRHKGLKEGVYHVSAHHGEWEDIRENVLNYDEEGGGEQDQVIRTSCLLIPWNGSQISVHWRSGNVIELAEFNHKEKQ